MKKAPFNKAAIEEQKMVVIFKEDDELKLYALEDDKIVEAIKKLVKREIENGEI